MGKACQLLSNPQAAEVQFRNALSVIDGCSADEKRALSHAYGLGKLFVFSFPKERNAMLVTRNYD